MKAAFEEADRRAAAVLAAEEPEDKTTEGKGGAPEPPIGVEPIATTSGDKPADPPSAPPAADERPETITDAVPSPKVEAEWRKTSRGSRGGSARGGGGSGGGGERQPHPIQGGRQGPIGLAHPPPPDAAPAGTPRGGRPGRGGRGGVPGSAAKADRASSSQQSTPQEPRLRKDVKIRQGGANDMGSLASRLRSIVIANQTPPSSPGLRRKDREGTPGPE